MDFINNLISWGGGGGGGKRVHTNTNETMDKCPDYQGVLISEVS